jgi:signal transduction histidine kinase
MTSPDVPAVGRLVVAPRPMRFSLSNWPVSRRLLALIAVAVLMGLIFGGLRVQQSVSMANALGQTSQLATLGQQVTALAQALEDERDVAAGVAAYQNVVSQPAIPTKAALARFAPLTTLTASQQAKFNDAVHVTDGYAAQVSTLASAIGSSFPSNTQEKASAVILVIANLPGIRTEWASQGPQEAILDYSAAIADLFLLNDEITAGASNAALADDVRTLGALSRAKDQVSQVRAILYAGLIEDKEGLKYGLLTPKGTPPLVGTSNIGKPDVVQKNIGTQALVDAGGLPALSTAEGLQSADMISFTSSATTDELTAYRSTVGGRQGEGASLMSAYVDVAVSPYLTDSSPLLPRTVPTTTGTQTDKGANPADVWYTSASNMIDLMRQNEQQLASSIAAQASALRKGAVQSAELTAGVTTGVLILVVILTMFVARSLVNPLRRLQTDALEIAAVRLPARVAAMAAEPDPAGTAPPVEPIAVSSTDEIGRVARAFDQVHAEALRLAGNEAAMRGNLNSMFISLSRRSVPLIDRLARMIDSMEQNEDDPDQLANLFAMDHLVTRMRRNSENLLVLAGEEPVRKWTEPVPLADVTRAAASEIEQYARVLLAIQPGILVSGQAAADIVHLLAELVENATMFSPRDTQIQVNAQEVPTGGVLIEIRDNGVGVSSTRLEDMNWRLDNPPLIDVSVSRHMGLFAVSRLAARHGVRVRLRPGSPQGLTALVWLPGHLISQQHTTVLGGHLRAFGADTTHIEYGSPGRRLPGRHRSELVTSSGGHSELAEGGRRVVAGRRALTHSQGPAASAVPGQQSEWFRAKRPSSQSDEEWVPEEQPAVAAAWSVSAAGGDGWEAAGWRADGSASLTVRGGVPGQSGRTQAGLPKRVPRGAGAGAGAGADMGNGHGNGHWAAQGDAVPAYSAPTAPTGRYQTPRDTGGYQAAQDTGGYQTPRDTGSYRAADQQRSPDTARSRLAGFQLGGREATGQTGSYRVPPAEEESGR